MARINITRLVYTLQYIGRPISMQYFTQVDCSLLFHGYGLQYNTRSKRFNEEIILCYTVQEEDTQYFTQVRCSHYFTWL